MNKLLKADFYRLKKDKVFWVNILIAILMAIYHVFHYYSALLGSITLDRILCEHLTLYLGFLFGLFVSVFIGKQYAEGTIRNKVIIGHSRINIYLSNLVVCISAGILIELSYVLPVMLIGTRMFGGLQMISIYKLMMYMLLIISVYCLIYSFVIILCQDTSIALVACVILYMIMFVMNTIAYPKLHEPEYVKFAYFDGEQFIEEEVPNPRYIGEKEKYYKMMDFVFPQGQAEILYMACSEISEEDQELEKIRKADLKEVFVYIIFDIVIISIGGMYVFKKEELK